MLPIFELPAWQLVLLALPILLNLWSIWHAATHDFATPQERFIWIFVAVVFPVLGGLAYILYGRTRVIN